MELASDIRFELVDEPSSHMSKVWMIVVQWRVPWLADLALASRRDFLSFPQVFRDQPWHAWQGLEASNWHVPLHSDSVGTSGDRRMTGMPNGNLHTVYHGSYK